MKSLESVETPKKAYELALELENSDDPQFIRETIGSLLTLIEEDVNGHFLDDVSSLYEGMAEDQCLARIERLSRVLEMIEGAKGIEIGDAEEHYANAVVPEPEGLKIAYSEGQAPGPVRSVIAFGKTMVGFKTDHIQVDRIDYNGGDDLRDVQQRMHLCRHVHGTLQKEDIRYLIMRIPKGMVKDELLTALDKQSNSPFVFRGLKINENPES